MRKPISDPIIADVAAQSAHRRAPSSPRAKRRLREFRHLTISATLITGSSLICLWLLLA